MPANSKITPALVDRITALHREGASAREIGEAIEIHFSTVSRWLKQLGLAPNGGNGGRATRERPPTSQIAETVLSGVEGEAELVALAAAMPGDEDALTTAKRRLVQFRTVLDAEALNVKAGTFPASIYSNFAKLEAQAAVLVAQLSPKQVADPDKDPTNLEAAAKVEAKFRHIFERQDKAHTCVHCGKHPHR